MIKRLCSLSIIVAVCLFLNPKSAFAGCYLKNFDQAKRDLNVCVDGFATLSDLQSITAKFTCTSNSATIFGCKGGEFTQNLRNFPYYAQDASGKYYTCVLVQGLNRKIATEDVTFYNTSTGTEYCKVSGIQTKPADFGTQPGDNVSETNKADICKFANNNADCIDCFNNKKGAWTAVGCISTDTGEFFKSLFRLGTSIAGGIAFLLILFSGFKIMTSMGNPEKLNEGKEMLTGSITGLIMILFSIFLLGVIGVNILGIPGFK